MRIRVRKVTVEKWPERNLDRIRLALWIIRIRWQYCDWTTGWLLVGLAALTGLLMIAQAGGIR